MEKGYAINLVLTVKEETSEEIHLKSLEELTSAISSTENCNGGLISISTVKVASKDKFKRA